MTAIACPDPQQFDQPYWPSPGRAAAGWTAPELVFLGGALQPGPRERVDCWLRIGGPASGPGMHADWLHIQFGPRRADYQAICLFQGSRFALGTALWQEGSLLRVGLETLLRCYQENHPHPQVQRWGAQAALDLLAADPLQMTY